jgi:hypothetical protein
MVLKREGEANAFARNSASGPAAVVGQGPMRVVDWLGSPLDMFHLNDQLLGAGDILRPPVCCVALRYVT